MIITNIVPEKKVREVQSETLGIIADALKKSFGPKGSTTAFVKDLDQNGNNSVIEYTKDGHTIVKNIQFTYPIERSVVELLIEMTRYIVKEVGDGTTSAIILCKTLFDSISNSEVFENKLPADILKVFDKVISKLKEEILSHAKECTVEDIYDIALISTNNNKDIAGTIREIYSKYGMGVYIDVGISNEVDNIVKEYDGMTLSTGYANPCMINIDGNRSRVDNPKIYCFDDPIDTPEMLKLLSVIIDNNILRAYQPGSVYEPIPTVILCKHISQDTDSYFEAVVRLMNQVKGVPLLIVSDIHQEYLYEDIAKMCGAPFIKKYLNPDLQQAEIDAGRAPTVENVIDFCGSAVMVEADEYKTKIIRPSKMFNEDGSYSDEYNMMVSYLESQVQKAISEMAGTDAIQNAKRRLNSFKGNMIDFMIGGMTLADRNNLKAAVEDAVFNCRSAATNGVGYGANYMAFSAIPNIETDNDDEDKILDIIGYAYNDLLSILYDVDKNSEEFFNLINNSIAARCPYNIRTGEFDGKVKSSIKSDIAILDTINRILVLMYSSNQYLVQSPMHNIYCANDK